MAFVGNDGSRDLRMISSSDGLHWSETSTSIGQKSSLSPHLCAFDFDFTFSLRP
jgi:hypothetical protein